MPTPPPTPGFIFVSSARLPCRFQTPPGTETGPVKEESQTPGRNPFYMGQSDVRPCVFVLLPWGALTGRSRGTESKACGFLEGDATEASPLQAWQMEVQPVVGVPPRGGSLGSGGPKQAGRAQRTGLRSRLQNGVPGEHQPQALLFHCCF